LNFVGVAFRKWEGLNVCILKFLPKKKTKVTGGVEICLSVRNAPKGKKLGVRK